MATLRVCFVGDSFVNGTGDDACLGWSGRVCAAAREDGHDLTYYNLGIRRETTADILARWSAEVRPRLPTPAEGRLVFSFGANDLTIEHGQPRIAPDRSVDHARAILSEASRRCPTLLVGLTPSPDDERNQRARVLDERYAALCADLGIPMLRVYDALLSSRPWLEEPTRGDGIHPNAGGYADLARLIIGWDAWQAWLRG
ncbi:MAG: GDSL-type esterase/lipase family protein [Chloroflexota bacterium]